ncbi:aminobenzoyl-glutamate transport protein [Mycoplasma sp. CAG:956]|nr:aminobenzoyl-glutamate transport protein [Mycoplasma sp. CAG:956]
MQNKKDKVSLNPIMTLMILIGLAILLSGILALLGIGATNPAEGNWVAVESLLSLRGIKYIFQSTVANFASFTPLSMLIIILIGIGIMDKSGFLKTTFSLITRKCQKKTITFVLALICIISSIGGDLAYVVMIPLSALLFYYGRRNPLHGIVISFAALTCGTGLSIFKTSVDSSLDALTLDAAHILDSSYTLSYLGYFVIMTVAIFVLAAVITYVAEKFSVNDVPKYEFKDEKKEFKLAKRDIRGLIFAGTFGIIYLLIFIYNIIPGLPLSGNLLDYSQKLYIDKLFNPNSFFSQGFVFIVTIWFVILGLFYGLGSRSIKNNNDFCDYLTHSLDGIGRTIILILLSSILINVFKKTNIGTVVTALIGNLISNCKFTGIPLLLMFFFGTAIATILLPNTVNKWTILASTCVPTLMNVGFSPEFIQVIFRFAESMTYGLTPIMAYFVIYLAYMEKYNTSDKPIGIFKILNYQKKYALATGVVLLILLIIWYLVGLPIGINVMPTI